MKNKGITKAKVELMEKIIRAQLTKAEFQAVISKAKDIINARKK